MQSFRINIPDTELAHLRQRITSARWPVAVPGLDWERGVPVSYLKELAEYWQSAYDWRAAEREINQYPQFTTEIDGANIHFLHIRSAEKDARPLLLTHGWPGSIVEFLDVIGPLTDPRAHGGDASDAFDLVIPSLPGHGFSGPLTQPGWDVPRVAKAWAELMDRLGYDSYLAGSGCNWGSLISLELARLAPERVRGAHLTLLLTLPSGDPEEMAALSPEDRERLDERARFNMEMSGYMKIQSTRPQTIGYGLHDSPVGQLAWVVEKLKEWNKRVKTPEEEVGKDRLLTNVSIYWLTGTATSSAHFYYESAQYLGALFTPGVPKEPVTVPIGVAVFGQEPAAPIRSFAERDYPTISHWSEFNRGGHFGSWEQPELFVDDVRKFARSLPR